MNESYKTNLVRAKNFPDQYLRGKVIDIGAGKDVVCEWAESFDVQDGDANQILRYKNEESYDTVYSSHCLEHMRNPKDAIQQWWRLVKPEGFLVVVVPDEDLYEQGIWPSRFNPDHKWTFRIDQQNSWSSASINILELIKGLSCAQIISCEVQSHYYDHSLNFINKTNPKPYPKLLRALQKIERALCKNNTSLIDKIAYHFFNAPIDQTLGKALAQIEIVCQKKKA